MPSDLREASVLNRTELHRLQQLKQQLEAENIEQKDLLRQAQLQRNRLVREAKHKVTRIQELELECNELQMKKFGRLVDLEALQMLTGSRRLEELKQEKRLLEAAQAKEIRHWDVKIEEALEASTEAMKTHNELLYKLSTLYEEKTELELKINARQKKLVIFSHRSGLRTLTPSYFLLEPSSPPSLCFHSIINVWMKMLIQVI
ncbi:hypothetical protein CHARACLAT_032577 [Characodon lateralis]|uniref:Uncharacterized protein n=1 Tax=Characodon lateralis TaxID=208331 RepID=A0ABU7EPJ8_9TELE|nr:hypothetical protein [Characodon lateralis]